MPGLPPLLSWLWRFLRSVATFKEKNGLFLSATATIDSAAFLLLGRSQRRGRNTCTLLTLQPMMFSGFLPLGPQLLKILITAPMVALHTSNRHGSQWNILNKGHTTHGFVSEMLLVSGFRGYRFGMMGILVAEFIGSKQCTLSVL